MGRDVRLCSDGRIIFNAADRIANRVNGACSKFEQASPAPYVGNTDHAAAKKAKKAKKKKLKKKKSKKSKAH